MRTLMAREGIDEVDIVPKLHRPALATTSKVDTRIKYERTPSNLSGGRRLVLCRLKAEFFYPDEVSYLVQVWHWHFVVVDRVAILYCP
jgi:hypothetical protein